MSRIGLGQFLALGSFALLLAPRKLQHLGRSLRNGLREFKEAFAAVREQTVGSAAPAAVVPTEAPAATADAPPAREGED